MTRKIIAVSIGFLIIGLLIGNHFSLKNRYLRLEKELLIINKNIDNLKIKKSRKIGKLSNIKKKIERGYGRYIDAKVIRVKENVQAKEVKTYTTANGTVKEYTQHMQNIGWLLNSGGKSKQYIDGIELYINDFLESSPKDRAKYLLKKYGLEKTIDTWETLGNIYNIDYKLPICIARADSGLGTQLKSINNIGNVGNNDRGDTIHYSSLEKGIEAIYKALNNRYLGKLYSIGYLSQGGRSKVGAKGCAEKGEFCYATSKENWNINVLNCMSMIYNTKIDENFKFRTK